GLRVLLGELMLVEEGGAQRRVVAGDALDFTLGEPGDGGAAARVEPARSEPLELRLSTLRGAPSMRTQGAEDFVPAPREPTPVREGTAVRVPSGAGAMLAGRSLRAQLASRSEGSVGAATGTPSGDTYALALRSGGVELDFAEGGKHRLTLTGAGGALEVAVGEETSAAVTQRPGGTSLTVRAGQAQVSSGGQAHTVRAGEVAELTASGLTVQPRPAPTLVLPARDHLRVYANALREVGLSLGREAGAAVRVEVATDASFREPVLAGRVETDHVVVPAPARGDLHWRTLGADGAEVSKGHARFLPDRARGEGAHPHAEIAETGQRAAVYFQGASPSLTFAYAAHPGAHGYRVRVYREGALGQPVLERKASGTRSTLEAGALSEGRYLWHAVPVDTRGAELAGGRMNRLELSYDNARRTLVLQRPRRVERADGRNIEVRGVAPLGMRLFLGEEPVALDAKGRFSLRTAPVEALVFRLVSADGSEAYWVRSLGEPRRSR
ncbi:MAG: hypothetical protein L0Y64_20470, partial [Myxococcaceae bacterium]|nr:hypothetical protein [Myxococcaceae bacterium]